MTREEKSKAVSDFCDIFFDANETGCFGCPLAKDVGDCTDRSDEENYDILAKAGLITPDDEIETKNDKVDEAHKRFMNIGEIKDSGNRREFETGAVRDMAEGKGRCDLLPAVAILRLAKHFERGAIKYSDRNWEKGIPLHSFIDSAIRHTMKYLDGQHDEDHLCAAAWNLICAMWTEEKHPELNDLPWAKKGKAND